MIDVVGPAIEPALGHHGAEVVPLVQILFAGGFGTVVLLAVHGALSGLAARGRSAVARRPGRPRRDA